MSPTPPPFQRSDHGRTCIDWQFCRAHVAWHAGGVRARPGGLAGGALDRPAAGRHHDPDRQWREQVFTAGHPLFCVGRRHHGRRRHGAPAGCFCRCADRLCARWFVAGQYSVLHLFRRDFRLVGGRYGFDRVGADSRNGKKRLPASIRHGGHGQWFGSGHLDSTQPQRRDLFHGSRRHGVGGSAVHGRCFSGPVAGFEFVDLLSVCGA